MLQHIVRNVGLLSLFVLGRVFLTAEREMDEIIFSVYYGKEEQKLNLLDFLLCAHQSSGAIPNQLLLAKEWFHNVHVYSLYPEVYHIL